MRAWLLLGTVTALLVIAFGIGWTRSAKDRPDPESSIENELRAVRAETQRLREAVATLERQNARDQVTVTLMPNEPSPEVTADRNSAAQPSAHDEERGL